MSKYNLYAGSRLHTMLKPIEGAIKQDTCTHANLLRYFQNTQSLLEGYFHDGGHMHDKCGMDAAELLASITKQKTKSDSDLAIKNLLVLTLELAEKDYKDYEEARAGIDEIVSSLHQVVRAEAKQFTSVSLCRMHTKITYAACKMCDELPKNWEPTPAPEIETHTQEKSTAETSRKNHMALGVALLEKCSREIFTYADETGRGNRGLKLKDRVAGLVRLADEGGNYDHLLHEFIYINKNKLHWDGLSEETQLLNTIIVNSHAEDRDTDTIVLCAHKIIKMVKIDTDQQTQAHANITMLTHKHLGHGEFLLADLNQLLREHREVIKKDGAFAEQCRRHLEITRDYVSSKAVE